MIELREDQGSFTIEASLLLPVIMFITMLLLFFCLYSYQKSMLLQVASAAAERTAYNWDNSSKTVNGSFTAGQYDSLYWRIGEDALLASLFGSGTEGGTQVELPGESADTDPLPVQKLKKGAGMVPAYMPGEVRYAYNLTGRKVSAELKRLLQLPVLDGILTDRGQPVVQAQSVIAEPVEFIRTIDLMRYYGAKFKGGSEALASGARMEKKDAAEMMTKLNR
ncbi:pilus assembly protein [Paenibacillus albidus]|uniref:TadE family protein n=1 Tax=Paenibacillus albidus TaxID=2041023 RepID=UPI001BE6AE71|nr:TadE family protein [Paenibacillus albidus]MBT2292344.1 pilus assembly protein [Paenibacillus albidus]